MTGIAARALWSVAVVLLSMSGAAAQNIPGWETKQFSLERLDADRIRLMREVEVVGVGPNEGQRIHADDLLWNTRTGELTAEGNVVLSSKTGQISAERVIFNTKTGLGTFYTASGMASLGDRALETKGMFGGLEPDVYFYGDQIEKIGDDKYRIHRGGFTTCVQPTARWDIVSGSATINLEDYVVLRGAVLRVKEVPVFYLPILYYPIQSDDRATGFLMPAYGNSTYQGHSISNAFFWAVNRSQDATFFHDYRFSRGQGYGAEYRYVAGPGSEGHLRSYRLSQKAASVESNGSTVETPELESFELRGSMTQVLPANLRATARLDYFSDITTRQLNQTNFLDLNYSTRIIAAGVTGSWGNVFANAQASRSESFTSSEFSVVYGSLPSVTAGLSSTQLAQLPLFVSANGELSNNVQRYVHGDGIDDRDYRRIEFMPSLRAPFLQLPYLTATASTQWRTTHFSEQIGSDQPISRSYLESSVDLTGPVFNRIFGQGDVNGARLKHVIEPRFSVRRTSAFEDRELLPVIEYVFPDVTRYTYGINNRVILRPATTEESNASTARREILTVGLEQSYYSNPLASPYDFTYSLSVLSRAPNNLSPLMLVVRGAPTNTVNAEMRMEYDVTTSLNKLQGLSVTGGVNGKRIQANGGWSKRSYSSGLTFTPDSYVQGSTTVSLDRGLGGTFSFNYDIKRATLFQQRWTGYYNAQCCGVIIEYQQYNYPTGDPRFPIPSDRRFNLSFSLAGVGSFSNFFGIFGVGTGATRY